MDIAELKREAADTGWLKRADGWAQETCWQCDGHGVVDRSYHNPDECDVCNGSGSIWKHLDSGIRAKWPGGPFV